MQEAQQEQEKHGHEGEFYSHSIVDEVGHKNFKGPTQSGFESPSY